MRNYCPTPGGWKPLAIFNRELTAIDDQLFSDGFTS